MIIHFGVAGIGVISGWTLATVEGVPTGRLLVAGLKLLPLVAIVELVAGKDAVAPFVLASASAFLGHVLFRAVLQRQATQKLGR